VNIPIRSIVSERELSTSRGGTANEALVAALGLLKAGERASSGIKRVVSSLSVFCLQSSCFCSLLSSYTMSRSRRSWRERRRRAHSVFVVGNRRQLGKICIFRILFRAECGFWERMVRGREGPRYGGSFKGMEDCIIAREVFRSKIGGEE